MDASDDTHSDDDHIEECAERVPDQHERKDTDRVVERTDAPPDRGETGFDTEAPGNYVDDEQSHDIPEPNEPA